MQLNLVWFRVKVSESQYLSPGGGGGDQGAQKLIRASSN